MRGTPTGILSHRIPELEAGFGSPSESGVHLNGPASPHAPGDVEKSREDCSSSRVSRQHPGPPFVWDTRGSPKPRRSP